MPGTRGDGQSQMTCVLKGSCGASQPKAANDSRKMPRVVVRLLNPVSPGLVPCVTRIVVSRRCLSRVIMSSDDNCLFTLGKGEHTIHCDLATLPLSPGE